MTYSLYLDDIRIPKHDAPIGRWHIARDVAEAYKIMAKYGRPGHISFDHDLGENEMTGYDFANRLVQWDIDAQVTYPYRVIFKPGFTYNVHSANPVGAENIRNQLNGWLKVRDNDGLQ